MRKAEYQPAGEAEREPPAVETRAGKETLSGQIRRKAAGPGGQLADTGAAFASAAATPSQEIPYRGDMEASFGQDFSGVRAHVGGGTSEGLGQLGARAATQGEEVAFTEAQPSRHLVAHELTHVVQARGGQGGVHNKSEVSDPGDAAELEADRVADRVVAGEPAEVSAAPAAGIHRDPDPTLGNPAPNINLSEVHVSFQLPAHRLLSHDGDKDISTRDATTVTITVSPTALRIDSRPSIYIDASYPANNMFLSGASYSFATGAVSVDVRIDQDGWGFLNYMPETQAAVSALIRGGLAGTPVAARGYNPMTDPHITQTLQALAGHFTALPAAGPGGAGVATSDMSQVSAGGTFAVGTQVSVGSGDGSVQVAAGGPITVDIAGGGTVAGIAAAGGPQAGADAAQIQSIHLSSQAIQIFKGRDPVARLEEATIARGGQVTIQRLHLLGNAAVGEGIEALVQLFAIAAQASSQGAPDEMAFAIGAQHVNPTLVSGITRDLIESNLTTAIQQMVRDNAHAIPGIDMAEVFGVAAAHAAPPPARR